MRLVQLRDRIEIVPEGLSDEVYLEETLGIKNADDYALAFKEESGVTLPPKGAWVVRIQKAQDRRELGV